MSVIFIPTIIAEPGFKFWEEYSHGICRLEGFHCEGVQSTPEMLIYPGFRLLARRFSQLKVVCGPKWMPWIPSF